MHVQAKTQPIAIFARFMHNGCQIIIIFKVRVLQRVLSEVLAYMLQCGITSQITSRDLQFRVFRFRTFVFFARFGGIIGLLAMAENDMV